jgi:hypothetical protein
MGFPKVKAARRATRTLVRWRIEGFYRQFDDFDPLRGTVPGSPFPSLPIIAARARHLIIKGRTRDELVHAAKSIDWLIDQYFRRNRMPGRIRLHAEFKDDDWAIGKSSSSARLVPGGTSEVFALTESLSAYRLDDDPNFPKGRDFEYLAVLALWKIADALQAFPLFNALVSPQGRRGLLGSEGDDIGSVPGGEQVLAAVEAACWGERLKANEGLTQEVIRLTVALDRQTTQAEELLKRKVKERVSLAARQAAIQKNAENRAMKAEVIQYYATNQHRFRSMDAAAEAIAGKIVPLKFRTVRDHLAEYRRTLRSARTP